MNRSHRRMCRGKVRHPTHGAAHRAMHLMAETTSDLGFVVYVCKYCAGFHIGHASKSEQKRLRFKRLVAAIEKANGAPVATLPDSSKLKL